MSDPASGNTIFCDDIRHEVGGKISLIGSYQRVLFFHGDLPVLLPKLCLYISYFERLEAFTDDLTLNVYFPGSPFEKPDLATTLNRSDFPETGELKDDENFPGSEPLFRVDMPLIMTPFVIKQIGVLRVRAICGDTITRLGALQIEQGTSPEETGKTE